MDTRPTHFIFDETKVVISEDLQPVIAFLQGIENETESFLKLDNQFEGIRKQLKDIFNFILFLSNKLKENSIQFEYKFNESPETIADKLVVNRPVRAEMIVLFAHLETLFCINIAYESNTSDKKTIIKEAMSQEAIQSFINRFCLCSENSWVKENPERAKRITSDGLRRLRNSLTHFFSVDRSLSLSIRQMDEHSRKLEKATDFRVNFITPEDFYGILKGAALQMMRRWSKECLEEMNGQETRFIERMRCVIQIVENDGAKIVLGSQIDTSKLDS